jgi:hypothetical protein
MVVMVPAIPFSIDGASGSHADPVVPVLLALVVLAVAAVLGGRLMTTVEQPPVLGELIVGLLIRLMLTLRNPETHAFVAFNHSRGAPD